MAHPHYNHQYPPSQHGQPPPPVQTQNLNHYPHQQARALSPPNYQHSPTAMSPNMGSGLHPAKRQRLSPNPPSPAPFHQSPYASSQYAQPQSQPGSPYAASPQYPPGHLSVPGSPVTQQPPSFHQPQPYQQNGAVQRPAQGSMPPPRAPYSKAQDDSELEKANARDVDVNNISDVLSGGFIDLRAEEDQLLHSYGNRNYGASFNSQHSGSTATANTSFNDWSQNSQHGAFQGTGPLSQSVTQQQHEAEFLRKHEQAARILNETAQTPLADPFVSGNSLRHRIATRAYDSGIQVHLDGLFDKIPEKTPRDTRVTHGSANGELVVGLEAASLLNQTAPLVEILSLLSLATEERIRTVVEDAYSLSQGRQHTSHGVIPPQLLDIAKVDEHAAVKMVAPVNILKTPWEAPDSAISPKTTADKQLPNAARLPTPPIEPPPAPQRTYQNVNHVARALQRRVAEDEKYEKERIRKRQKRLEGSAATAAEAPIVALPPPDKMTKKDKDALKKTATTDEAMHRKANETASMALGSKKKKYAWMNTAGTPGASIPRPSVVAGGSGVATPGAAAVDKGLIGKKKTYGGDIETTEIGARIQLRDLIQVLQHDGRERKTLAIILARQKTTEKDEKLTDHERRI